MELERSVAVGVAIPNNPLNVLDNGGASGTPLFWMLTVAAGRPFATKQQTESPET